MRFTAKQNNYLMLRGPGHFVLENHTLRLMTVSNAGSNHFIN